MHLMRQMRCNCIGVPINCQFHKKSAPLPPVHHPRQHSWGAKSKKKKIFFFIHLKYFTKKMFWMQQIWNENQNVSSPWLFISLAPLKWLMQSEWIELRMQISPIDSFEKSGSKMNSVLLESMLFAKERLKTCSKLWIEFQNEKFN